MWMLRNRIVSPVLIFMVVGSCVFLLTRNDTLIKTEVIKETDLISVNYNPQKKFDCVDRPLKPTIDQRGEFWVLNNYIRADQEFGCDESITISAPGDFRFVDNLPRLADIWQGPISVALYAPGDDFKFTLECIAYLRNCESLSVRRYVTFHLFFEAQHTPKQFNKRPLANAYEDTFNCSKGSPYKNLTNHVSFKAKNDLLFPINTARNVARQQANTHLVFPLDIELYPTTGFINKFFDLVKRRPELFAKDQKNVFVLPIFEIKATAAIPNNKTELQAMLKKKTAMVFHRRICYLCHNVIDSGKWIATRENNSLNILATGKRYSKYMYWEPFYVCTNDEPWFDERLTWEGQSNKMSQAFSLCVLDYNFMVLDNAFLIHRPGIKKQKVQLKDHKSVVSKTSKFLKTIRNEIYTLFGYNKRCYL